MAAIWSDESKLAHWLDVELAALVCGVVDLHRERLAAVGPREGVLRGDAGQRGRGLQLGVRVAVPGLHAVVAIRGVLGLLGVRWSRLGLRGLRLRRRLLARAHAVLLVVAAATGGWRGLRDLLGSLDPRRIGLVWYPLALFAPPLALVLAEAVVYGSAPLVGMAEQWPIIFTRYLPAVLTTVLVTTGIAEELGWRGFAQPRLQARYGPLAGSLILGAAAALWHLPNAVLRPGGLLIFALQALIVTIWAVPFTWVYNHNHGSVLIVALFHAAINTSGRLVAPLVPIADRALLTQHVWMVMVGVASLVALLLIIVTRGRLGLAPGRDGHDTR
jgi:membrane protease YdiL (CAAX protease family)